MITFLNLRVHSILLRGVNRNKVIVIRAIFLIEVRMEVVYAPLVYDCANVINVIMQIDYSAVVGILDLLLMLFNELKVLQMLILIYNCLLYTSPSPRDLSTSRMPSSA